MGHPDFSENDDYQADLKSEKCSKKIFLFNFNP